MDSQLECLEKGGAATLLVPERRTNETNTNLPGRVEECGLVGMLKVGIIGGVLD